MPDPNLAIMLVCKAFYTSLALQFLPHNILNVVFIVYLVAIKEKKRNMKEISILIHMIFSCGFIVCVWRKAIAALSYFSRDFWRGLEIAPLLLESCLMISFQISLLLSLNICPNFDIFKKIVVQSIIIMGWIDYLRKYMLKP